MDAEGAVDLVVVADGWKSAGEVSDGVDVEDSSCYCGIGVDEV